MRYSFDDRNTISVVSPTQQLAISKFVSRTYGWMVAGLATTGAISWLIATNEAATQFIMANSWVFFGALIAEFVVVMGLTMAFNRLSTTAALLGFGLYSALNGVTFSTIFMIYTMSSIAQVFFITAGMFAGLAVFGTVTKKDLTPIGTFFAMGIWGILIVGLVNMFIRGNALSLGLSAITVVIFSGLTAWDAQKIRAMAIQYSSASGTGSMGDTSEADKGAIFGALTLYLDFINLFLALLRLFGTRRD